MVTPAWWLGRSTPAVTLGYYAHFMQEAAGRIHEAGISVPVETPSPGLIVAESPADARLEMAVDFMDVDCMDKESGGLGKC
jgi:hypothetical protein